MKKKRYLLCRAVTCLALLMAKAGANAQVFDAINTGIGSQYLETASRRALKG